MECLLSATEADIHISPFEIIYSSTGERDQSLSVVVEGNKTLIPKTDLICFKQKDTNTQAIVSWTQALTLVGEVFAETTYIPARSLITHFPDSKQFELLQFSEINRTEYSDVCWLG